MTSKTEHESEPTLTGSDERHGYKFGVDGVCNLDEALRLLGGITKPTFKRLVDAGRLRVGKHHSSQQSHLKVCRRSIFTYLHSIEV